MIRRHGVLIRLTHWVTALAAGFLLVSGLQIFNAHPALYWGHASTFDSPWLAMRAVGGPQGPRGMTEVAGARVETTGVLGLSGPAGAREARGFPAWTTLPSYRDLASGRRWHFFFAWVFVASGGLYLAWGLASGRLARDLLPGWRELSPRHLWHEVAAHARLRFPKGEAARRYNTLQKLTYLTVMAGLLPLILLTGLSMSPGMNAAWPWLIDLFGGRQSARSLHFIAAALLTLFVLVHLAMVVASGPWNNLRSMVTGRYAITTDPGDPP